MGSCGTRDRPELPADEEVPAGIRSGRPRAPSVWCSGQQGDRGQLEADLERRGERLLDVGLLRRALWVFAPLVDLLSLAEQKTFSSSWCAG